MVIGQSGSLTNQVSASQTGGSGNTLSLSQNGESNLAQLAQNGSGNHMDAIQNGARNQLTWTRTGDNLVVLQVTQNGGQAIMISQSH